MQRVARVSVCRGRVRSLVFDQSEWSWNSEKGMSGSEESFLGAKVGPKRKPQRKILRVFGRRKTWNFRESGHL